MGSNPSSNTIDMWIRRPPLSLQFIAPSLLVGYCLCVVTVRSFTLSREFDVGGKFYGSLPGLRPGWMWGRSVDLSDIQWREFRGNLPVLTLVMAIFVGMSRLIRGRCPDWTLHFYIVSSLAFVGYLHGSFTIHVILAALLNFFVAKATAGTMLGSLAPWVCNCSILILARVTDGLPFSWMSRHLHWVDTLKGPLRWHIGFNLVVLRFISFSMDHHWMKTGKDTASAKKNDFRDRGLLDPHAGVKARSSTPLQPDEYNLLQFLVYVLYPPLYIAGPTSTYNNFAHQLRNRGRISAKRIAGYGVRFLVGMLVVEAVAHTMYVNSIAKYRLWKKFGDWDSLTLSVIGFWVLIFMWLKFFVIWRFFRFWSLADDVEPPENMCRCLCNNYDIEGFWKNWHASYNLWLVRYIYLPLGGSKMRLLNVWCVFTFVALWHDLEWKLLGWAWMMAAFIAPEMGVKWAAKQQNVRQYHDSWWFPHLRAGAASLNIAVLMTANMVGFVVGLDGVGDFLRGVFGSMTLSCAVFLAFFSAAHLMFGIRALESERGKRLCPMG
ncbi:hypothetical protein BSKO_01266 [Bryopsis sp. KO-2023]|nr:hypothetical protein BSKO_01266 [Bryopsis sp. KO-2023]